MKIRNARSLLILASLWFVSSCASNPRRDVEPARAGSHDQATLTLAAQNFLGVFDNLDWERFQASWSSNPTAFFPFADTPERVEGSAVMTRFRQFFDDVRARRSGPPFPSFPERSEPTFTHRSLSHRNHDELLVCRR